MVRQQGFDRQLGRNQVANHGGNVVAAALSGWLGWRYGFGAVFVLSALFGLLSIAAVASMTVQGAGAALSPALGGILAHRFGYPAAFIALGAVSTGSLVLWLSFGASLRHVRAPGDGAERDALEATPPVS